MKLKHTDEYCVYTDLDNNEIHYYKNGKYHRETGPAVVVSKDIDKYSNLVDENLYMPIEFPIFNPGTISFRGESITEIVVNLMKNCSRYYLEGIEYSEDEFNAITLKKELDSQLHINETVTWKLKL